MPTQPEGPVRGRIAWIAAWALSLVLAFVLGHQMASGPQTDGGANDGATPAETAAAASSPDPQVAELLGKLPRRQVDDPLAMGSPNAKVVLTEWSDFGCPYCARWATQTLPELQRFVDDGTLRIEYRDLAVMGEQSVPTAVAARAAGRQDRFWEFYSSVFAVGDAGAQPDHSTPRLMELARTAGVPDLARFEAELADPALREKVEQDTREAQQLGITSTPFFVVGTTVINGARPTQEFIAAIEQHAR